MRKLSSLLLIALLALVGIGCDSDDDEGSDAELFVGTWALTGVSDDDGDAMEAFATNFESIVLANDADGSFTLTVNPVVGDNIVLPGTYTVSESNSRLTLTVTTPLGPANLNFTYAFNGDDEVELTSDTTTALLLNTLFEGVDLVGQAVITVSRVS